MCEELLKDKTFITTPEACLVFDLNNLKLANDTLGHSVGDQLISNFARLLRNAIPAEHFVGRYGGDEFLVILSHASHELIDEVLKQLDAAILHFNSSGKNVAVSYAYGYALSSDDKECTIRTLFDKADQHMYENKKAKKASMKKEDDSTAEDPLAILPSENL